MDHWYHLCGCIGCQRHHCILGVLRLHHGQRWAPHCWACLPPGVRRSDTAARPRTVKGPASRGRVLDRECALACCRRMSSFRTCALAGRWTTAEDRLDHVVVPCLLLMGRAAWRQQCSLRRLRQAGDMMQNHHGGHPDLLHRSCGHRDGQVVVQQRRHQVPRLALLGLDLCHRRRRPLVLRWHLRCM